MEKTPLLSHRFIGINHDHFDEKMFEEEFSPVRHRSRSAAEVMKMLKPPEPVLSAIKPPSTCRGWLDFFLTRLPIIGWVLGYQPSYFVGDIISGITVAIMQIPQGLAYALLANLHPVYGLYTSFMPVIIYSIFGTSRHLSIGTFAVVELMIGNAIDRTLDSIGRSDCQLQDSNADDNATSLEPLTLNITGVEDCDSLKMEIAITLAFLAGIIMLVMGILRLGFITIFLSEPLISGYTTGAACHVFTSQLTHITGVSTPIKPGLWSVPLTWINTFKLIREFNLAPIIIAALSIAALIVFKICNVLLQKPKVKVPFPVYERKARTCSTKKIKWPIPIPSQLIVVVVATIVSNYAMFESRFDVTVVGTIPKGPPSVTIPNMDYALLLLQDAFIISIVTFAVTISLAKVFAKRYSYSVDSNQEFVAYGIMNIVGCFFSSFPAASSLSRSSVQANAGGNTQLVGFISSLFLLSVLLLWGPLFEQLPRAVLAAIIWVALYRMFSQVREIWRYFQVSVWDMLVWIVVFLATMLLGVDIGLGVGVGFSLLVIIIRTILPHSSTLGKAQGSNYFRNTDHSSHEKVKPIPGIVIFRFQAPLCFINSGVFRARLEIACDIYKNEMGKEEPNGCIKELFLLVLKKASLHRLSQESDTKVSYSNSNQAVSFTRNKSFQQAMSNDDKVSGGTSFPPAINKPIAAPVKTVIIDCAPIGFMDIVGIRTLQQTVMDFDKIGIKVLFVAMTEENQDLLAQSGFFQKCSKRWLFPSIQDAVEHAMHGLPLIKANNYMSSMSSGEDSRKIIQEDQEPDNDQQPIKVAEMSTEESTSSSTSSDVDISRSGSNESTQS